MYVVLHPLVFTGYRERVMVLYDGLHYDALAVAFEGMETVSDGL